MSLNQSGAWVPAGQQYGGGLKAKTLKRMLKKAGLKVSGKKSTLTKRAKKAHLIRGGVQAGLEQVENSVSPAPVGGRHTRRRHRHRRRSVFRKFW